MIVLIIVIVFAQMGGSVKAPLTGQQGSTGNHGSSVAKVGQSITVTGNGNLKAVVRLASARVHGAPKDASIGSPPANGEYVVADVTISDVSGQYDFNPLYFNYVTATSHSFTSLDGNAAMAGFDPSLSAGTLSAGDRTGGFVTFDVPKGAGAEIQLTDPLGSVIGTWKLS
jgi:hypothetical protein